MPVAAPALIPSAISRSIRAALFGLPLGLALYLPQVRAGQAGDPPGATTLDRIQVQGEHGKYQVPRSGTAMKTDTALINTPQAVTVITDQLIRDQSMQSMGDVVRYVPGVQMAQGEGHRDAPILRGNTSTADFFINGVRDDVQYYRDLYNVERVEVLKGPSGMIFGRGGSGGLINRVTKQANWSEQAEISATLGSWDHRRITGDFNHAMSDTAAFRITGMYEDSESYRDEVELKRWAINPTLTFRANEATTIALGYEHFEDDRITDRGVPSLLPVRGVALPTDRSTFFGNAALSPNRARIDALTATVTHDFGDDVRLVNQTRYADYDKFYQNVFPGAYTAANNRVAISAYNNLTARKNLLNQTDLTFNLHTGAVKHSLLVGVELGRQETENFRETGYFPAVGANATSAFVTLPNTIYTGPVTFRQAASDADNRSVAKSAAVYVQDQIEFSPQWLAVVGVRLDRFEADLRNNRNGTTLSSSDDLFSPRVGVIYKPRENISVYASHTLAYVPRAGEQLASLTPSNRNLDPEKFTNDEIGVKWEARPDITASLAVYQLDRTNVAIVDPNNPAQSLLVDGQRVRGVELEASGQITDAWQIMGGYAYQDSEIQTPGAQDGNRLGQVPKHSFSLWNRYDFNRSFGLGLGVIQQSRVYVAADNTVTLPSFTRVDAAAFYNVNDKLRLQLNVENLFDKDYYASAHSNNNILPGSPRAVRVGLTYRF